MVTKEKNYFIKNNIVWRKTITKEQTVFKAIKRNHMMILSCGMCGEELGVMTGKNIEHQSEYHSCS